MPLPAALSEDLAALMVAKDRDALVFTDQRGGVLRNSNWRSRVFRPAVLRCQSADDTFPTITPHDLRHTPASLAVSERANVKAVQRMLGHAKASMTLDIYADLFDLLNLCGARENRTPDLLDANETRYQLRYSPLRRARLPAATPRPKLLPGRAL